MTVGAFAAADERHSLRRAALWGTCLTLVVAAHLAAFVTFSKRRPSAGQPSLPPAVMIDLTPAPAPPAPAPAPQPSAPKPVSPPQPTPPKVVPPPQPPPPPPKVETPPTPVPPPPKVETPPPPTPVPPPPVPTPVPLPVPVEAPPLPSDMTLPMPPPPAPAPPPRPRPARPRPAAVQARTTTKPVQEASPTPPAVATPATAAPAEPAKPAAPPATSGGADRQDWQSRLVAHIAQYKAYPAAAENNGWQGMSIVRFTFSRSGAVLAVTLVRSSGHAALDDAALATLRRASPLPPPPASVPGDPITLTLPLQFSLDED